MRNRVFHTVPTVAAIVLAATATFGTATRLGAQAADTVAPQVSQPILILDQEVFFNGTLFGQRTIAQGEAAAGDLAEQNRVIETELETEERALTQQRKTMDATAFRLLADAFDVKVQGIRQTQDAKAREIAAGQEDARQMFLNLAIPVLSQVVQSHGAVVILDRRTVFLSSDRIDITAEASALFDEILGDGAASENTAGPLGTDEQPVPEQ